MGLGRGGLLMRGVGRVWVDASGLSGMLDWPVLADGRGAMGAALEIRTLSYWQVDYYWSDTFSWDDRARPTIRCTLVQKVQE